MDPRQHAPEACSLEITALGEIRKPKQLSILREGELPGEISPISKDNARVLRQSGAVWGNRSTAHRPEIMARRR